MRGVLGLLPEMGLVAMGVTILMIAGEFDISVGSVFALAPMVMAISLVAGFSFAPAVLFGLAAAAGIGFVNGCRHAPLRHPLLHHDARHAVRRALDHGRDLGRLPAVAAARHPRPRSSPSSSASSGCRCSGSPAIAVVLAALLSLTNFGNWIKATGGQIDAAAAHGHPDRRGQDDLLHALRGARRIRRNDPGAAARLAAAVARRGARAAGGRRRGDRRHVALRRRSARCSAASSARS